MGGLVLNCRELECVRLGWGLADGLALGLLDEEVCSRCEAERVLPSPHSEVDQSPVGST